MAFLCHQRSGTSLSSKAISNKKSRERLLVFPAFHFKSWRYASPVCLAMTSVAPC